MTIEEKKKQDKIKMIMLPVIVLGVVSIIWLFGKYGLVRNK
jgi:hypothetical protein